MLSSGTGTGAVIEGASKVFNGVVVVGLAARAGAGTGGGAEDSVAGAGGAAGTGTGGVTSGATGAAVDALVSTGEVSASAAVHMIEVAKDTGQDRRRGAACQAAALSSPTSSHPG